MKLPKYRLHKSSGQAVVEFGGKRHYLGRYGSPESKKAYDRIIREILLARDGQDAAPKVPAAVKRRLTVDELVWHFLEWAEQYHSDEDGPTSEYSHFKYACDPLSEVAGDELAEDFGPARLKAVRQKMVTMGWARVHVNRMVNRLRRVFKWAVENELVTPTVLEGLRAVAPLRKGKTKAPERPPVATVADKWIEPVLPHVSAQVKAMIQLQRLTGMRAGEVVLLRPCDVDRTGEVWVYSPPKHKGASRGATRRIFIGPKAQANLLPFLERKAEEYCFSPREAEATRNAERRAARKSPMTPSQAARRQRRTPLKQKRLRYDVGSYRRAITYGLKLANKAIEAEEKERRKKGGKEMTLPRVSPWSPLQLRHNRGTEVRRDYGLEGAQVTLGHAWADVTQVYAERDTALAIRIARETG